MATIKCCLRKVPKSSRPITTAVMIHTLLGMALGSFGNLLDTVLSDCGLVALDETFLDLEVVFCFFRIGNCNT